MGKNMPGMDGLDDHEEVVDEVTGEKTKKKKKGGMNDWMSKLLGGGAGGKDSEGDDFDLNAMMKNMMGGGGKGSKHKDYMADMMGALGGHGKKGGKRASKYDDAQYDEEDPYARFEENDADSDPTSSSHYAHHTAKKQKSRDNDYDIDEDSLQQLIGDDEELKKLYMDHYHTKQTPGQANAVKGEM